MLFIELAISITDPNFYTGAIGGLFVGVMATAFFFRNNSDDIDKKPCKIEGVNDIDLRKFEEYKAAFRSQIVPPQVEAINVSVEQWYAINKTVADLNGDLNQHSGFRLWFGLDPAGATLSMALPLIDNANHDQDLSSGHINTVQGFDTKYTRPCPNFCD